MKRKWFDCTLGGRAATAQRLNCSKLACLQRVFCSATHPELTERKNNELQQQ
jgi:hypothetical protein